MAEIKLKKTLDGIKVLETLTPAARAALAERCQWRRYKAGEQIIDRESDNRDVFFVTDGTVRVVNYSVSGREITLDDAMAGGHFGHFAALDGEPRSANVLALTASTIAMLSPGLFTQLLIEHPQLALALMRDLARLIRQSTVRIMDLSTLGANNRVHAELLRLARRTNKEAGNRDAASAVLKPIPVHGDIASRVSTTRETVARVLGDLGRQGIVHREGDALRVVDLHKLEEMVLQFRGE
jgi:CRP-like cAMP-binding protein